MTSAWPATEAAIHRWVRESTGIAATACYWPSVGLIEPNPPCCEMKIVGGRQTGWAGVRASKKTAQPVEWLATITAALGTHGVQLWTDSGEAPDVDAEVVVINPATTITQARDALLADLSPLLPVTITATANGIIAASERVVLDLSDVTIARELRNLDASIEQLMKLRQSLQYRTEALQAQRAKPTDADADPFADITTRSA